MPELGSYAEQRAKAAEDLESFPINLAEIKRSVASILSFFGRGSIFSEYTLHDISHIDDMLRTLDWLIPEKTKQILTPADWLMVVLSIYFHDMGLVVTDKEFEGRNSSGFRDFCDTVLFSSPGGGDYKAKVDSLPPDAREKFLYQEFVRKNHGKRVRSWIEGNLSTLLGEAHSQVEEIDRLLKPLDKSFRKDLALVCESHNLDDIENTSRYKPSQPYGNSDDETANVQYCAVILRTVDLLQITRGRAPAVLFRLIDPVDPISQSEWAKQQAVKRVRAQPAVDKEGQATSIIQSDTIEVFATFHSENGYFGLTSYLRYARNQIAASHEVMKASKRLNPKKYEFPWKYIDDANVDVEGFEKKPFGFEIDQEKILELLTGHTLYNDTAVVIRELIQNALDAVRLRCKKENQDSNIVGHVKVTWDPKNSVLRVVDNGTGMTQNVIENHLLKVGSSQYQDPKFRDTYPDFSSISRFGIGVLSCFMVADNVEILTVSPDEDQARKISLRSVHGKYLIKLLDKYTDSDARSLGHAGTSFRLQFRPSAEKTDVLSTVKQWIMFPRCPIEVKIGD